MLLDNRILHRSFTIKEDHARLALNGKPFMHFIVYRKTPLPMTQNRQRTYTKGIDSFMRVSKVMMMMIMMIMEKIVKKKNSESGWMNIRVEMSLSPEELSTVGNLPHHDQS